MINTKTVRAGNTENQILVFHASSYLRINISNLLFNLIDRNLEYGVDKIHDIKGMPVLFEKNNGHILHRLEEQSIVTIFPQIVFSRFCLYTKVSFNIKY